MAGREMYREEIVIDITGDSQAIVRLRAMDRYLDQTRRRGEVLNRIRVNPAVTVQDRITSTIRTIESRLGRLGGVHRVVIEGVDRVTNVAKRIINTLTSPLALLGGGAGAAASIIFPLKLSGEMEQARLMADFYTGSEERGKKFMDDLSAYAAKTPFTFPFLREMSTKLLGAYSDMIPEIEERIAYTTRTLNAFGNAAGYLGATPDQMKMSLIGFRQIAAIGILTMEELRQVTENLGMPMGMITKELGLTQQEMKKIGEAGIPASRAMEAILSAMEKNFAGGMKKMSMSYFGLLSTLQDTGTFIVMAMGSGMAGPVKRILLDMVGTLDYTSDKYKAFSAKMENFGKSVGEGFEQAYHSLKAKIDMLSKDETFMSLDFGGKMVRVLDMMLVSANKWVDTDGGKEFEKLMSRLAAITISAWKKVMVGTLSLAWEEAGKGNLWGAGMFISAFATLGGLAALRFIYSFIKGAKGAWGLLSSYFGVGRYGPTPTPIPPPLPGGVAGVAEATSVLSRTAGRTVPIYGPNGQILRTVAAGSGAAGEVAGSAGVLQSLSKVSKVAAKWAWPVAIAGGAVEVATSKNKVATAAQVGGGLAGAWAAGEIGAAIGTAILPGIGTIVGGLIGGGLGYFGGRKIGSAIVHPAEAGPASASDLRRIDDEMFNAEMMAEAMTPASASMQEFTAIMTAFNANLQSKATDIIARMGAWSDQSWSIAGIATSFSVNLQGVADSVINNGRVLADAMAAAATQAGAFMLPTVPIPTAAHAFGGIFNRPHLGLVAEAGPEAIIPLSERLRGRATGLWNQVGESLGLHSDPVSALAGAGGVNISLPGVNVSVSMAAGEIDEDALALTIGRKIVKEIMKVLENKA